MKVLLVEDNPRLAERMKHRLKDWYIVDSASSGHEALVSIAARKYNAVILDLNLPDMHGLEVCRRIRTISVEVPILVVTGEDGTPSKVELLNNGADDYLTKPFDSDELRARLNALTRRRFKQPIATVIEVGDLTIDPAKRIVSRAGIDIKLRKKEFDILEYLALNRGRVLTREMIVQHAWSSTSSSWVGSVDVHIKHLRDKVDKPFSYSLIKTVYAVGYILDAPDLPSAEVRDKQLR